MFIGSPSTRTLLNELNGVLINTNTVLDYPRLQPPTFINIGGIQIRNESLPKEVESFLNESLPHGAILFTMGFIFEPSVVPIHRIISLFEVFGALKQKVIAKFDVSKLPSNISLNIPSNVMALPFLPQVRIKMPSLNLKLIV